MMKRILAIFLMLVLAVTSLPALADNPTPIEKIPYDQLPENREGIHHYLLLCMDSWNGGLSTNSDGIVLLTLDTKGNRIMLTTLMRDSLVERPDGVIGRINYIVKNYGPEALCNILSTHLGIKVEKYIIFNFQQVANIVDYMGGVDLEINSAEARYLRNYPLSPTQTTPKMKYAGNYHFIGRAAVIYMRCRKADGNADFGRNKRVRTVLSILADKCRVMTYEQAEALLDSVVENSTATNMTATEMITALQQAFSLRSCVIEELALPAADSRKPIEYAGMSVQDVNWAMCREDMAEYLRTDSLVIDNESMDYYD